MVKLKTEKENAVLTTNKVLENFKIYRKENTAKLKYNCRVIAEVEIEKDDTDEDIKIWLKSNESIINTFIEKSKKSSEKRANSFKARTTKRNNIISKLKEADFEQAIVESYNKNKSKNKK